MGFFDMFKGGGGSLAVQAASPTVTAGGSLAGTVAFQGGKRAQQITNIKVKLVQDQVGMETATVNGKEVQRKRTNSRDVIKFFEVAPAFQSTPEQVSQFPFDVQLPADLLNSAPDQVKYRLVATADIDNAMDPGAHAEIQVVGGAPSAQAMQQPPAKHQPQKAPPTGKGAPVSKGQAKGAPGAKGAPVSKAQVKGAPQKGAPVSKGK